jgi:IMP cyclohydrolase
MFKIFFHERLMPKCKDAISNLTEQQSEHVELNPIISDNCAEVLKKHCEVVNLNNLVNH